MNSSSDQSSPSALAMESSSPNSHKFFPISPLPSLSSLLSHLPFNPKPLQTLPPVPIPTCSSSSSSSSSVTVPFLLPVSNFSPPQARSVLPGVRIEGLSSSKGVQGGPAFVGQVFTMLDPSGNGLMAVARHFNLPFLTGRTPEWLKRMFKAVTKSDTNGPVFRFFMDLNDAVSYVKKLNVPAGMVGACRLDIAYGHFREKPSLFQFVPNEKQVKAANKLLKSIPQKGGRKKLEGVPVFTAQNLNIAIATNDGIRWYTPYFFDKGLLDNILEASIDEHFDTMIQNRHVHRRRDVIDDSLSSEIFEEPGDTLFEPPEVQELMDEMGHSGIPLSVISKAAEIELLDVVDRLLLGNKWLRKAIGIQPKFPYLVESFQERSAASFNKASTSSSASSESNYFKNDITESNNISSSENDNAQFPFGKWIQNIWPGHQRKEGNNSQTQNISRPREEAQLNPLLPNITMVGISMGDGNANSQINRANLKKTMDDLTKDLEKSNHKHDYSEENDPLFVANVGDYSRITRF